MTMTAAEEPWVTLRKVAEHLDMHYQTAWAKTKRGEIPGHRIDDKGEWRFKISEVDARMKGVTGEPFAQSAQSRGRRRTT